MKCNDFDAHIDEMLSGILHPDANQHMRLCERCTSHYRARAEVQTGLRKLASASAPGPSHATDRAVMDAYRRLQQRRPAAGQPQSALRTAAQLLTFPSRGQAPARASRNWWSGAAAAAVVLAVLGSGLHLRNGLTTVSAPTVATAAPAASAPQSGSGIAAGTVAHAAVTARLASRRSALRPGQSGSQSSESQSAVGQVDAGQGNAASSEVATAALGAAPAEPPVEAAKASNSASPLIHLASAGADSNVAQSASSTWPGYSNLVYCDPVVCSGPMQVVHIKVPVGQVKPNVGQSGGNGFVNADVVVGPDGVARAIRVAN
jgi:hypothetical protein